MKTMLSTREVARFLNVNEKIVYGLISDKGLPATKITGKWLFPRNLVEAWIEANTMNYPSRPQRLSPRSGLLVIAGSNDPLLDRTIALFNSVDTGQVAVFGNLGSLGGLKALRQGLCHLASSHLMQDDEQEYNFAFAEGELENMPALVNFCRREQGLLIAKTNPKHITGVADLSSPGIRMVNRPLSTGTRLLLDHELRKLNVDGTRIEGYRRVVSRHLDVGLEILAGRADVGPAIRAVAGLLDLDFIPLRWERYDLMIAKEHFFDEAVQNFLGVLHEEPFRNLAGELVGYDLDTAGKMVYPGRSPQTE